MFGYRDGRAGNGGRRTEIGGRRSEDRGRKSEVGGLKSAMNEVHLTGQVKRTWTYSHNLYARLSIRRSGQRPRRSRAQGGDFDYVTVVFANGARQGLTLEPGQVLTVQPGLRRIPGRFPQTSRWRSAVAGCRRQTHLRPPQHHRGGGGTMGAPALDPALRSRPDPPSSVGPLGSGPQASRREPNRAGSPPHAGRGVPQGLPSTLKTHISQAKRHADPRTTQNQPHPSLLLGMSSYKCGTRSGVEESTTSLRLTRVAMIYTPFTLFTLPTGESHVPENDCGRQPRP